MLGQAQLCAAATRHRGSRRPRTHDANSTARAPIRKVHRSKWAGMRVQPCLRGTPMAETASWRRHAANDRATMRVGLRFRLARSPLGLRGDLRLGCQALRREKDLGVAHGGEKARQLGAVALGGEELPDLGPARGKLTSLPNSPEAGDPEGLPDLGPAAGRHPKLPGAWLTGRSQGLQHLTNRQSRHLQSRKISGGPGTS
jgi:hypothetical protein